MTLMRYVRNPDTPDAKPICFRTGEQLVPERLVEFLFNGPQLSAINHSLDLVLDRSRSHLRKPVSMRGDDRDIPRLRIRIIQRDVLFHSQGKRLLLFVGRRCWIFPDILAGGNMLDDAEGATDTGWRRGDHLLFAGAAFLMEQDQEIQPKELSKGRKVPAEFCP